MDATSAAPIREPLLADDGKTINWPWLRYLDQIYRKTGESTDAPVLSDDGKVDLGTQVDGELPALNTAPAAQVTAVNYANVDSVVDGATRTIRVYGAGGVGTMWPRDIDGKPDPLGPFPSATLPGYAADKDYDVHFSAAGGMYMAFDPATQFAQSLRSEYRYVGRVHTQKADGTGGSTGGGGSDGGEGGSLLGGRLKGL